MDVSDRAFTKLLASYVPKLIQKRVIQDSAPITSPLLQDFHAVVLFADISGFTALTERLDEKDPVGVETLARILNQYFGQLIDIIYEYAGDVVKFAGDALIAVWPIDADRTSEAGPVTADSVSTDTKRQWTLRVAECALKIREQLLGFRTQESALSLKVALATGPIRHVHIGGVFNRWEFVMTGSPLVEVGIANNLAKAGDILISPSAFALIRTDGDFTSVEFSLNGEIKEAARLERLRKASLLPAGKERIEVPDTAQASLRPYIPASIIHRISAGQSEWLAELRKITILFINLVDPSQITSLEMAQDLLRAIQRMIYRFEGSLNKISQDDKGIMIDTAFGLPPLAHRDDPVRAIRAALMIRDELRTLGIQSSIGITTGRVFCGLVGNDDRRLYTFLGNSVILAARLMTIASLQEEIIKREGIPVLCDRATYEAARDQVDFDMLPAQPIKGRSEPVDIFHPIREKKAVFRQQTELIGRTEEKALLVGSLHELLRGLPFQAVILHGEAGIGKTRLIEELLHQAQVSQVRSFHGEGNSIEKNSPYFAWRPIFSQVFGTGELVSKPQLSDEDRAAVREAVLAKLNQIDPELARSAPLLSVVLPVTIPENEFTSAMTGEVRGSNIRDLLVQLLQNEADQSPILVALEDLHWFDSASWTLLADVYQKVRPLLLVVNTRPLSRPVPQQFKDLAERSDIKFLKLDMMTLDDVEELVCQRLGVKSVPVETGRLIREKSEGHPFFAEELAYSLRDSGAILIEGDECRPAPGFEGLDAVTLPDNLQAAITSRIDGLNPSQQLTLKVASVIGRIFAYRMLEAIHPIETDRDQLGRYMDALTRLRLTLIESEVPDLAYIFKHAVTQEVAYNMMLFSQRRQLHQAVAEWIEQNYQQDIESFYTLLAYHWTQAANMPEAPAREVVVNKAIDYLEKAGDQSLNNFANAEAVEFFRELLQLTDMSKVDKLRLGQWYRKLGDADLGLGKLVETKEYILKAMATLGLPLPDSDMGLIAGILKQVARQAGHRIWPRRYRGKTLDRGKEAIRLEFVVLTEKLAVVQFLNGDPNPLPMLYGVVAGLNVGETLDDTPELWAMYATMSAVMGFIPLHSQAQYYKDRWFALGETIHSPNFFIDGASALSAVASGNGLWQEVNDLIERSSALCEEMGDHRRGAEAVAYLGINKLLEGGPNLGGPYNKREWDIAMRRENPIHIAFAYQVDCTAMVWKGEYEECIANAKKCLALSEKSWVGDIPEYIVRSAMWLAMWLKGEREGVWEFVKAALDKFAKASVVDFSAYLIHSHLAEVTFLALEEGQQNLSKVELAEIEKYAKLAIKNLKKYRGVFLIGGPALDRYQGQSEWHQNRHEKAYQFWRSAVEKAHAFPITYEEGRAELLLGQNLPADDPERALHLQKARGIFKTSGYENWAAMAVE
jgi:class 3 adenylate cyclase/tetratricopeptide (TPR) repeat protein